MSTARVGLLVSLGLAFGLLFVLPLPTGERAGVKGPARASDTESNSTARADHPSPPAPLPQGERGVSIDRLDAAVARGRQFLLNQQAEGGAWQSRVYAPFKDGASLTPLALRALIDAQILDAREAKRLDDAIDFLVRLVRDDGSIDTTSGSITYPVYTAANAVVVLSRSRNPRHIAARNAWLAELRRRQMTEDLGWRADDEAYGGWSYSTLLPVRPESGKPATPLDEPNLSATAFALEAMRAFGCRDAEPAILKALQFVKRCQNLSEPRRREGEAPAEPIVRGSRLGATGRLLPVPGGGNISLAGKPPAAPTPRESDTPFDDGGFFFILHDPVRNKAGGVGRDAFGCDRFASYGSTTADGLRCLVASGLTGDDPRVAAARKWLRDHFAADSHPGGYAADREHAREGLYFYYARSTALALAALSPGDDASRAEACCWAAALAAELVRRQRPDGSWSNSVVSVREDDPLVATPFAVETLTTCRAILTATPVRVHAE